MSDNWKALQKTLKPTTHPTPPKKRPRSSLADDSEHILKNKKKKRSVSSAGEAGEVKGKGKGKAREDSEEEVDDDDDDDDGEEESVLGPDGKRLRVKKKNKSGKLVPVESILAGDTAPWQQETGQYLALDCEMVGIGPLGSESTLARVSIVNYHGHTVLDRFVRPREKVMDYRTWVSGVREQDLKNAPPFSQVQKEVSELLTSRILIGHALSNDTAVLLLSHPWTHTRDTAKYQPLQGLARTKKPGLKSLAKLCLGVDIQSGEHSSVLDARATMAIYRTQKAAWESSLKNHTTPVLLTTTTPTLLAHSSLTPLPASSRQSKRPPTLGLAATLRIAREETRRELEEETKIGEVEMEERKREKVVREVEEDLLVGFDFDEEEKRETVVVAKVAKNSESGTKGVAGEQKKKQRGSGGGGGATFKGDREKRPKSKEGWWDD